MRMDRSEGNGLGQMGMGQVRREWARSDGNGPGQTGMDQVRREWTRSDGNGPSHTKKTYPTWEM